MNKLALVVVLLLLTVCTFFALRPTTPPTGTTTTAGITGGPKSDPPPPGDDNTGQEKVASGTGDTAPGMTSGDTNEGNDSDDAADASAEQPDRPATEVYKDADSALSAVKAAAVNYDDMVLDQFTLLGPDCSWCDTFYRSVRDMLNASDTPAEQKSYYAELLAISGRVDNVENLVSAIESGKPGDDLATFTQALEQTVGKEDVVRFLSTKLSTPREDLRESIVAAISNQGTPLAIETLYKNSVDSNNPDGFYSKGTGLGEVIPEPESYPLLKEMMQKRDDYSHLAVKSLLNSGLEGVKLVIETLNSSPDPERDRAILKDAADHVNYDEAVEKILKDTEANSKNASVVEWAKATLASFSQDQIAGGEELPMDLNTETGEEAVAD